MAINRFRRVMYDPDTTLYNYTEKEYLPSLEGLDSTMGEMQQSWDEANTTPLPKYLKPHYDFLLEEYVNPLNKLKTEAIEGFTSGDNANGRRALTNIKRFIYGAKQPGGAYAELESAYNTYQKLNEDYKTKLKDAPGYYLDKAIGRIGIGKLQRGLLGKDVITDPNIGQYIDIMKDLDNMLDGWEVDEDQIIKMDNKFIWKIKNREVTEDEIRGAVQSLLQNPRYRQQLDIEKEVLREDFPQDYLMQSKASSLQSMLAKNYASIDQMSDAQAKAEASKLGVTGTDIKKALKDYAKKQAEDNLKSTDYDAEIEKQFNRRYVDPLVSKYAFKSTSTDVDERQDYLVGLRHSYNMKIVDLLMPPAEGVPFAAPAVGLDMDQLQKQADNINIEKASVWNAAKAALNQANLGSAIPDMGTLAKTIDAFDNSKGDKATFMKNASHLAGNAEKVWDMMNTSSGVAGRMREFVETAGSLDNNYREIDYAMKANTTAYLSTNEGKTFWDGWYKTYSKDLKSQGIDSPEELKQHVESGKPLVKYQMASMAGLAPTYGAAGATALDIAGAIKSDLRSKSKKYLKENPTAAASYSPTGYTGDSSSIPGKINDQITNQIRSVGFGAYAGVDGELPKFMAQGDNRKTYDSSEVELTSAKGTVVDWFGGRPKILVTGKVKTKNGDVSVYTYMEPHHPNAQNVMAYSGAELYANSLDTQGRKMTDQNSVGQRKYGAAMYFYNSPVGKSLNLNVLRNITPEAAPSNLKVAVSAQGVYRDDLTGSKLVGTKVTSVELGADKFEIYTSRTPLGDQVYRVIQETPTANGTRLVGASSNGMLTDYKTIDDAVQVLSEMYTEAEVYRQGLYKIVGKDKVRVTQEGAAKLAGQLMQ